MYFNSLNVFYIRVRVRAGVSFGGQAPCVARSLIFSGEDVLSGHLTWVT